MLCVIVARILALVGVTWKWAAVALAGIVAESEMLSGIAGVACMFNGVMRLAAMTPEKQFAVAVILFLIWLFGSIVEIAGMIADGRPSERYAQASIDLDATLNNCTTLFGTGRAQCAPKATVNLMAAMLSSGFMRGWEVMGSMAYDAAMYIVSKE